MKKILKILLIIITCTTLIGCNKLNNNSKNNNENMNSKLNNSTITIDGIYLNNEYTDDDNLHQVILFYTLNPKEKNIKISSNTITLKINDNEYEPIANETTPNLTQYYYSEYLEDVYIDNILKVAAIFKIPDGDLQKGKEITFIDLNEYTEGIKLKTDNIKQMDNLTSISLDIDKEYTSKRQEEENQKLTEVDTETSNKIQKELNGSYIEFDAFVGQAYTKYKLEFFEPNKFQVTSKISGASLTNEGTYRITKGYIILHYDTNNKNIYAPYNYENEEITMENPFYSNGSDKIF